MPELKRITPEEVLKALTENELTPYQGSYTDILSGKNCACGLSAFVIGMGNKFGFLESLDDQEPFVFDTLSKDGFEKDYLAGFVFGFDGRRVDLDLASEIFSTGFEDGKAAWELVKHLTLPEDDDE